MDTTRRRFLRAGGLAGAVGLAGCVRTVSDESRTPTPANKDTDGDGVIDSVDYAPRDPAVQRKSQVAGDATATETASRTDEPTRTATSGTYRFEKAAHASWPGSISVDTGEYLAVIRTDGSDTAQGPTGARVIRSEGRRELPQRATFEIEYTRNTVENNLSVGLKGYDIDDVGHGGVIQVVNAEPAVTDDDRFSLLVNDGEDWWTDESFRVGRERLTFDITYDGSRARAFLDGSEVGSLAVDVDTPLYGGIALEDDPDTTVGDTVRLLDYAETVP